MQFPVYTLCCLECGERPYGEACSAPSEAPQMCLGVVSKAQRQFAGTSQHYHINTLCLLSGVLWHTASQEVLV